MLLFLTYLLLVHTPSACGDPQTPHQILALNFEAPIRTVFRTWGSHGDLEPSEDGQSVFWSENGPDGLVLKQVSLLDGTVTSVEIGAAAQRIAIVPGDPHHIVIAWQNGNGASLPYTVAVVNVNTGVKVPLDVGENGGDGRLYVSPSGRFLATGTDCRPEGRWWSPRAVGVFSLATARRAFTHRISGETRVSETRVYWTTDDKLVLSQGATDIAFRRVGTGSWARTSVTDERFAQGRVVQRNFYPSEPFRFQRMCDNTTVEVTPQILFGTADEPSAYYGYSLPDRAIAVRVRPTSRGWGWDEVDVVVLRWKAGR